MDDPDWVDGVSDVTLYEKNGPPELSVRCRWWTRKITKGWRPGATVKALGNESAARWYGVYIWEYKNVIKPTLIQARMDLLQDWLDQTESKVSDDGS